MKSTPLLVEGTSPIVLWSATPNMFTTTANAASEIPTSAQLEGAVMLSRRRLGHPVGVQAPTRQWGEPWPVLGTVFSSFMHEICIVELPNAGAAVNSEPEVRLSVMTVSLAHDELAPVVLADEFGVPLPTMVSA